jgi:hypothetical protein
MSADEIDAAVLKVRSLPFDLLFSGCQKVSK